jgi:hypothetical protein
LASLILLLLRLLIQDPFLALRIAASTGKNSLISWRRVLTAREAEILESQHSGV